LKLGLTTTLRNAPPRIASVHVAKEQTPVLIGGTPFVLDASSTLATVDAESLVIGEAAQRASASAAASDDAEPPERTPARSKPPQSAVRRKPRAKRSAKK
jgi:hypothetical protein